MTNDCEGELHSKAKEGIKLFNDGRFFDAHEELEEAWREETGKIRELYQGVLQVAVMYLHITRGNYAGALKVYDRSLKWLGSWPDVCRGINISQLRQDAEAVMNAVQKLGTEKINEFNTSLFKPVIWMEKKGWICDRCGIEMIEKNCKVTCPNCGNRFDCSDLNLYFD
jgi:predicted metal-dependent hydrolase